MMCMSKAYKTVIRLLILKEDVLSKNLTYD
jgi:hypothetical protein